MEVVNYNNKIYFIKKNFNENDKFFNIRIWYIIKQINLKENKDKSFHDIINISNLYINKIKNGCIYNI
jgi:hypothetical protein